MPPCFFSVSSRIFSLLAQRRERRDSRASSAARSSIRLCLYCPMDEEEEDTCMSFEEEDASRCPMDEEEEDTCMSYEEEDISRTLSHA